MPELNQKDEQPATTTGAATTSPATSPSSASAPLPPHHTLVKVSHDYRAHREDELTVHKGELLQLLESNKHQDYVLVLREDTGCKGLVPGNVVKEVESNRNSGGSSSGNRPWHMKLRKPSFNKDKSNQVSNRKEKGHGKVISSDISSNTSPTFTQPLVSVTVQWGGTATLTCRLCGKPRPSVVWIGPDHTVLTSSTHLTLTASESGYATLTVDSVTAADCGEYSCTATNDLGSITSTAKITIVTEKPTVPSEPLIESQTRRSVHLHWTSIASSQSNIADAYSVHGAQHGVNSWKVLAANLTKSSHTVENLNADTTYVFRITAHNAVGASAPGPLSQPVSIPTEEELSKEAECSNLPVRWQSGFESDYKLLSELARGRFSVVYHCVHRATGVAAAVKCVCKRLSDRDAIQTEYNTLNSLKHKNLITVTKLYETPQNYNIIMQLIPGGYLFSHLLSLKQFNESQAACYVRQILNVTQYLHANNIAHLDIKPENLLVDDVGTMENRLVKLVDFGDASRIYNDFHVHSTAGSLEFCAPEIVHHKPVSLNTDIWSVGVVVYVMCGGGTSPFIDDTSDTTTPGSASAAILDTTDDSGERTALNTDRLTSADLHYPPEQFMHLSSELQQFISSMLQVEHQTRPSATQCLQHTWIKQGAESHSTEYKSNIIDTTGLTTFMQRRSKMKDLLSEC